MGLPFDNLKSIIGKLPLLNNNNINSNNDSHDDNRSVKIDIHINLPENREVPIKEIEEATKVMKQVLEQSTPDGYLMSNPQSKDALKLIGSYDNISQKDASRKFVEENIPQYDRSLWFSALILKEEFKKGDNDTVGQLKHQISTASPGRGNNIANLCSAGYLESHIVPLYQYLVIENGQQTLFVEIYETIVMEFPFAVFVSAERSIDEIEEEIVTKIKLVKKYGWVKVSVHGIGETNVSKIREIIPMVEKECAEIKSTDISSYESKGKIVAVNFNLK